jgi:hypothetical protein
MPKPTNLSHTAKPTNNYERVCCCVEWDFWLRYVKRGVVFPRPSGGGREYYYLSPLLFAS